MFMLLFNLTSDRYNCCLDDNGPQQTETHDDIHRNRRLDFVAVQSQVTQSRNTFIDGVVNSVDGHRAEDGSSYICGKNTIEVIHLIMDFLIFFFSKGHFL